MAVAESINNINRGKSMIGNKRSSLLLFVILIITALVFSKSINNDFIENWDDNINVTQNNFIKDFSWNGIKTLFDPQTKIGEPRLTQFTFMLQYKVWKLNPMPYHLANLFLHLLNILLVFFFIKTLSKNKLISLLTALMFALHPTRIEPVVWVTGRKDLLFTFFFLASLIAYLYYLKKENNIFLLLLVIIMSYLSFTSKIQAVSIPLVLLAIDIFQKRKIGIKSILEKVLLFYIMFFVFTDPMQAILLLSVFIIYFYKDKITKAGFAITQKKYIRITLYMLFACVVILLFLNLKGFDSIRNIIMLIIALQLFFLCDFTGKIKSMVKIPDSKKTKTIIYISFATIALFVIVYLLSQHLFLWTIDSYKDYNFVERFFMAGYSIFFYLIKFIAPFDLNAIYPYPKLINGHLPLIYYLYTGISLTGLSVFGWLIFRSKIVRNELVFGSLFFLINIFLVLHIIPIEGRVIVAERYTYLGYIGLFFIISVILNHVFLNKNITRKLKLIVISCIGIYVLSFIIIDMARNTVWKNGFTLFSDIIKRSPDYDLAYNNRGTLYYNKGDYDSALKDFDMAIIKNPDFTLAYYNRALIYVTSSRFNDAIRDCDMALTKDSAYFDAFYLRAFSKNKLALYDQAILDYNKVIKLKPDHLLAIFNRGNSRKNLNDYRGAISDYTKAIVLNPKFSEAYNGRGVAKYFIEDYSGSVTDYEFAIRYNTSNGNIYYNKALSEIKLNKKDDACNDLKKSIELGYEPAKEIFNSNCNK